MLFAEAVVLRGSHGEFGRARSAVARAIRVTPRVGPQGLYVGLFLLAVGEWPGATLGHENRRMGLTGNLGTER